MVDVNALDQASDPLVAGYQALERGNWEASRASFQVAVAASGTAEALEGLAAAAWWLDDVPAIFESRERAYHLYRQQSDRLGAARMATWIGLDHYFFRGELAITNGWLQRAHRLLDGLHPSFEQCFLTLMEAHIALFEHNDVAAALTMSADTWRQAHTLGSTDLEMFALALEGLALVSIGQVREGMRRLDESTTAALAGEMSDPDAIVTTCCYLIYACERVRDFDRAAQWCTILKQLCQRWSYRSIFATCRTHFAAVLMWRGDWSQADTELSMATRELAATRPGWAGESIMRLAELRRRQGRLKDAAELFDQLPAHPLALLGRAELALERGETLAAADLADRFLRRVPPDDRTVRAVGLELAIRIQVSIGAVDRARELLDELDASAGLFGTAPLQGAVSFARGGVAAGVRDFHAARNEFEDAVDHFRRAGAPFELALAQHELARTLSRIDRRSTAIVEATSALATFNTLGAVHDARRTTALLRELGITLPDADDDAVRLTDLSRREVEVLRLVADGLNNQQIAEQLFISVRTVERHISTIYAKIGAEGSSARAIAVAFALQHGLAQLPDA